MNLELENKARLVTASSGGIGKRNCRIAWLERRDRSRQAGARLQALMLLWLTFAGGFPDAKLESLAADNGTAAGTEETIRRFPQVEILINNLGIYEAVGFFEETDEGVAAALRSQCAQRGPTGASLPENDAQLGRAAESSLSPVKLLISPSPEMAHYSATKTMQLSLSRSLARTYQRHSRSRLIRSCPAPRKTEGVAKFVQEIFPGEPPEEAERRFMQQNRPTSLLERLIEPQGDRGFCHLR